MSLEKPIMMVESAVRFAVVAYFVIVAIVLAAFVAAGVFLWREFRDSPPCTITVEMFADPGFSIHDNALWHGQTKLMVTEPGICVEPMRRRR